MIFKKYSGDDSGQNKEELRRHYHLLISQRWPRDAAAFLDVPAETVSPALKEDRAFLPLRGELLAQVAAIAVERHEMLAHNLGKPDDAKIFRTLEEDLRRSIAGRLGDLPGVEAAAGRLAALARRAIREGVYRVKHASERKSSVKKWDGWLDRFLGKSAFDTGAGARDWDEDKDRVRENYWIAVNKSKAFQSADAASFLGMPPQEVPELLLDKAMFRAMRNEMLHHAAESAANVHIRMMQEGDSALKGSLQDNLRGVWVLTFHYVLTQHDIPDAQNKAQRLAEQVSEEVAPAMSRFLRRRPDDRSQERRDYH